MVVTLRSARSQEWLGDATEALKALDDNHLTVLDSEGSWGRSTPRACPPASSGL